ncbi:MAG: hypothetical protein AAFO77_08705 [Pseudomonadota bacterium]
MRARRISIITGMISAITGAATPTAIANPFIEADPMIERGAAAQLAQTFGELRGTISGDVAVVRKRPDIDAVTTQAINTRALTPGQWLQAKRHADTDANEAGPVLAIVAVDGVIKEPPVTFKRRRSGGAAGKKSAAKPTAVPIELVTRPVRVIYTANAPLWERSIGIAHITKP